MMGAFPDLLGHAPPAATIMTSVAALPSPPHICPERRAAIARREAFIVRLRERCEQREVIVELNRTRVLLREERRRLRDEAMAAELAAEADDAWLRGEAAKMALAGWTRQELREIGFAERFMPLFADSAEVEEGLASAA